MNKTIIAYPFELKKADLEAGEFEGHAAVFNNVDSQNDIIMPGAFEKTLKENAHRVKILSNHDALRPPIGRPLFMEEDDTGLFVRGKISMTQKGRDILTLIKDGVITELSIAFQTMKESFDKQTGIRIISEVRLWEFSPVTWAANDQAKILTVKSMEPKDVSAIYNRVKALGFPKPPQKDIIDPDAVQSLIEEMKRMSALLN